MNPSLHLSDEPLRALLVGKADSDNLKIKAVVALEWESLEWQEVGSRAAFIEALPVFNPHVILLDAGVADMSAAEALGIARRDYPAIPVILVATLLPEHDALELIKQGARDFVSKDFSTNRNLTHLPSAIRSALAAEHKISERKSVEAALRDSETRYRALVETTGDIIWESDQRMDYTYISPRVREVLGYSPEELLGKRALDLIRAEDAARMQALMEAEVMPAVIRIENRAQHRDGHWVFLETSVVRIVDPAGGASGFRGIDRDITERKRAQFKVERLSKLYAALSQINEHVLHCDNRQTLFELICRDSVEFGGLKFAWIGEVDPVTLKIVPLAHYGDGADYLTNLEISADENSPLGHGPTGVALRENRGFWCQDFQQDVSTLPWHQRGSAFSWGSSAALPLQQNGRAVAVLSIYAGDQNAFDEASRNLIQEMVTNISFALDKFQKSVELELQQTELRATKNRLQATLDAIPDLMFEVDATGRYLSVHAPRADLLAAPKEAIIGRSLADFLPPDVVAVCMTALDEAGKTGWSTGTQYQLALPGGISWFELSIAKRPDSQPEKVCFVALVRDISARKKMETHLDHKTRRIEALLKINEMAGQLPEKEFLRFALELAEKLTDSRISFIHFVNNDGETIELVTWSESTEAHYCTACYETHYPVTQAGVWANCLREKRAVVFNDYPSLVDKRGLPDGHAALSRLMSIPVIEEGIVRVILGVGNKSSDYDEGDLESVQLIGNDIWRIVRRMRAENQLTQSLAEQRELNTRLSAAKTQLLQSEKMASIGILAAGVAHEINNPIGYVNSNLGTLGNYLTDIFTLLARQEALCASASLPPAQLHDLAQLKQQLDFDYIKTDSQALLKESREGLERVKRIILDLKNFSRSESQDNWQWADIHQGLDSTLTIVWNELKYKCELVKEYGELPLIYCLPSQLNQVFMNLLVNAAQSIETHGRVTIRSGVQDESVWVEIADTGSGIRAEILPRIFDPFFTTKPVGHGTGLGLPVSYGIVERHHGRIEVESEPGKGSTFRVWLPVRFSGQQEAK